ncbi:MAG: YtxH domain-containing protein, partial [Terriglobales bacterium]
GLGVLFAPARGEETREQLSRKAEELAEAPRRKVEESIADARRAAGDKGAELGRKAAETAVDQISGSVTGTTGTRRM